MRLRTFLLTALTLVAFAANSLLCRRALAEGAIDPAGFTAIRLGSGALVLLAFVRAPRGEASWSVASAASLFLYAIAFSLAYVALPAGVGALLLFGSVQATMLAVGALRGERLGGAGVLGLVLALGGLGVLVAPGLSAPDPLGALGMVVAGVGWGAYSLLGRGVARPVAQTARNFVLAAPLGALALAVEGARGAISMTGEGVLLAVVSGAVTSGLGYVLWYAALRGHSRTSAALVQLLVPLLAAAGGAALLGETLGTRFLASAALTLGGVALAILRRPAS